MPNEVKISGAKVFNRACKADPKEKLFLKISNASKK